MIDVVLLRRIDDKKKRLDSLRPLPKEGLQRLREVMFVELTYNSNAIEGNTLTKQETKLVLEEGLTIGGKTMREHLEAINHIEAMGAIESELKGGGLSEAFILYLHSLVLKNISENYSGKYRDYNVRISGSDFVPPEFLKVPSLMNNFVADYNEKIGKVHPVELAAFVHFKLVDIHPFADGNGRTARLLMNLVLLKHGFPITVIQRAERVQYYAVLEKAHFGSIVNFYNFVARAVERSLDIYLHAFEKRGKDEELISLSAATKYCDYSQEYLSLLARKGILEATKVGRNWKTTKKAVLGYSAKVKMQVAK